MKSKKWDLPANDYSNTVLSVFENDTKEKIKSSVIKTLVAFLTWVLNIEPGIVISFLSSKPKTLIGNWK